MRYQGHLYLLIERRAVPEKHAKNGETVAELQNSAAV